MAENVRSGLSSQGMRPEVARRRIETFRQRFKEPHFYFAQHAAFPLALTPDLLYRLWANFQRNIRDEKLKVPWIAVADLLLSPLCEEVDVGYELYEMDVTVRVLLLNDLQANPRFGKRRLDDLSSFLQDYARQQLKSSDPSLLDTAQGQRWTALAYMRPGEVACELAEALTVLYKNNAVEQVRITSLMETLGTLAEPLAALEGFAPLLTYAQGIANSVMGNEDIAQAQTSFAREAGLVERALGIHLPTLAEMQQTRDMRKDFFISHHHADQDWSEWIGWQLEEVGYAIVSQEWSFRPGSDFEREIDTILQIAKRIIVVLSPDYLNEFTAMRNWGSALVQDARTKDARRTLIAVQVRECVEELKSLLGNFVYTDFVDVSEQQARDMLLRDVNVIDDTDRDILASTLPVEQRIRVIAKKPSFPDQRSTVSGSSPAPFVFISYSNVDNKFVARLRADLSAYGITTWVDRENIVTETRDWEVSIQEAIRAAHAVLFIASPDSRRSHHARAELNIAAMYERPVYPIWVAGESWIEATPIELSRAQYIDARDAHYHKALSLIVAALEEISILVTRAPLEMKDKKLSVASPRIFIAHSSKDNEFSSKLAQDLRRVIGIEDAVWNETKGGLSGEDLWVRKIEEELRVREVFIVILSPDAMNSVWVCYEIDLALSRGKQIIPLLYRQCEIRANLKPIRYISFLPPKEYEVAFNELSFALGATVQSAGTSRPETAEQWKVIGDAYYKNKQYKEALEAYEQAIRITPDASLYVALGNVQQSHDEIEAALGSYEEALPLMREVGDRAGEAATLNNMAGVYHGTGRPQEALKLYEEALPITREVGDRAGEAATLNNMALVYSETGRPQEALKLYEEALALYETSLQTTKQLGDIRSIAVTQTAMADVLRQQGKPQEALALYEASLQTAKDLGEVQGVAVTEANLAQLLFEQGEYERGLLLAWDAYNLLQAHGYDYDAQTMQSILVSLKEAHFSQFTLAWEQQIKEEQPDWLRDVQEGTSSEQGLLPAEQRRGIVANTIVVMTEMPEKRAEWSQALSTSLQAVQEGSATQEAEYFAALLSLIAGQAAVLPADHPYVEDLAEVERGLVAAQAGASAAIEMSEDVVQAVRDLLTTRSWEETQQVLVQQQARLFQPAVEELLQQQIVLAQNAGEQRAAEMLILHLELLRESKTRGIERAFATLAQKTALPFDAELAPRSHAALRGGPAERMAHMQYLNALAAQTSDEGTKQLIEAIQLALLGGDASQLGQGLNGMYRQVWEAIVRDQDEGG